MSNAIFDLFDVTYSFNGFLAYIWTGYRYLTMYIGFDDTDSVKGMCTTYLAAKLCQEIDVVGLPKLVRLNPNIPYKTRGNAAISLKTFDPHAKEKVLDIVKKYSMVEDAKTNPGVVFLDSPSVPKAVKNFYLRTVSELVSITDAEEVAASVGAEVFKMKNGRGIIGALSAIGFHGNRTFELIAYRKSKKYVKERKISRESVFEMNDLLFPESFDNIDYSGRRVIITPHGRDPIFCGIRGVSKSVVTRAWDIVEPLEDIEYVQVFETNQATDAHLRLKKISNIKPYDCVTLSGRVSSAPKKIRGGHVIFTLSDDSGSIDCAAYKPSKNFRDIVSLLVPGDEVNASGGLSKYVKTVNLEKIEVTKLVDIASNAKPICCGKNMTSAGKNKGFKCKKCGNKVRTISEKVSHESRSLFLGFYDVPAGSRRHLSRPVFLGS